MTMPGKPADPVVIDPVIMSESVPNHTERGTLTNLSPGDAVVAQRPIRTLVQDDSGRYWLQNPGGSRITPSGSYDFVTMPDGSIRVARPNVHQDFSTHLGLSGGGEVKYAGSIRFGNNDGPDRGTIVYWTNNSGHYAPPATLRSNAGLPDSLFKPY
jgi:filamentous hemagglutinin